MEQGLISKPRVAIVGAGPAGCMCALIIQDACQVVLFDVAEPLLTLLPTGGGRCNLAHNEFDFKELAKSFPRGEKFLYSAFSRFSTSDTLEFFEKIGVKTYSQDDGRIFPISNSAKDVRNKMISQIKKSKFIKEKVLDVQKIDKKFYLKTSKDKYIFDYVVIATGTHFGEQFLTKLPHKFHNLKPALCGLTSSLDLSSLKGVVLKDVTLKHNKQSIQGDLLFTNNGISGPCVFKLSSINSRLDFPYSIKIQIINDFDTFLKACNSPTNKEIHNFLSEFMPKSFAKFFLKSLNIDENIKFKSLNSKTKELIYAKLKDFELILTGTRKGGETVFSGGIDLSEVTSNFQSKLIDKLYFCGEILDIDGFCGGYNLQNCWSSGYLTGINILNSI